MMIKKRVIRVSDGTSFDVLKIRRFFRFMIRAQHKLDQRNKAHADLNHQFQRVKSVSLSSQKKDEVERELQELKNRMMVLLQKEQRLPPNHPLNINNVLKKKLEGIEKRLDKISHEKEARFERLKALEAKIDEGLNENEKEIGELEAQIDALSKMYNRLKENKTVGKKQLTELKKRIDTSQNQLKIMKKKEEGKKSDAKSIQENR